MEPTPTYTVDEPQPTHQTLLTCQECTVVLHHPCVRPQTSAPYCNFCLILSIRSGSFFHICLVHLPYVCNQPQDLYQLNSLIQPNVSHFWRLRISGVPRILVPAARNRINRPLTKTMNFKKSQLFANFFFYLNNLRFVERKESHIFHRIYSRFHPLHSAFVGGFNTHPLLGSYAHASCNFRVPMSHMPAAILWAS